MTKTYGAQTEVSTNFPEKAFPTLFQMLDDQIRHETSIKGLTTVGDFTHRKETAIRIIEKTGEAIPVCVAISSILIAQDSNEKENQ